MNIAKFITWIVLGIIFLSFVFFSTIVAFVTDWWWFTEVGYTEIFIKSLGAKVVLGLTVSIIASIFLLINFLVAVSSKIPWLATIPESLAGQPISLDNRMVEKLCIIICLVVSLFFGLIAAASWQDVLKFINSSPFGVADPVFNKDIAFYI